MNDTLGSVKDNIRAMLRLAANDAAAQGEIDNALMFAKRLMNKHNLEECDLNEDDTIAFDAETAEWDRQKAEVGGATMSTWESSL